MKKKNKVDKEPEKENTEKKASDEAPKTSGNEELDNVFKKILKNTPKK